MRMDYGSFYRERGFSLMEVLLASVLGVFLLMSVIEVYLSVKVTWREQLALAQMQQNGRFITQFLLKSVSMANHAQCKNFNKNTAIYGYHLHYSTQLLSKKIIQGTDAITINGCQLENGKNEQKAVTYFIADTGRKNTTHQSILGLYELLASDRKRELAANVENMHILYGVLSVDQKNIETYLKADQVKNWLSVGSVEIALLINSEDFVLQTAKPFVFAGQTMPADKRLHKEWDIYIALRTR